MDCRIEQQQIMKSNFKKRVHNYLLLNILLLSQLLQAQPGFGDAGDNVQDIPVSSIGSYEYSILVIVSIVIFVLFRKRMIKQV
jgi:hypothetical protein